MSLYQSIIDNDKNYLLNYVYSNDTGEDDVTLASKGMFRVKYNNTNYLVTQNSDWSGFTTNRFNCIKDYLQKHTTIVYSYTGWAGTEPDPLVNFVGEITSYSYSPPQYMITQNDFANHLTLLLNSATIQDKLKQVIAVGAFNFMPINITSLPVTSEYYTNILNLSTTINTSITSAIGMVTASNHGLFSGSAVITNITLT